MLHLYLLAAFIMAPFNLYARFLNYCFNFIDSEAAQEKKKSHTDVWSDQTAMLLVCIFYFVICSFISLGVFKALDFNPDGYGLEMLVVIAFIIPSVYLGARKLYSLAKAKFCKPITYTE